MSDNGRSRAALDHVGLNVADLAAAEQWYAAAFGYAREFAAAARRLRARHRDAGAPRRAATGSSCCTGPGRGPGLRADTPPEAVLTEGFGHVAFDVDGRRRGRSTGWSRSGARSVMTPRPSPEPGVRMAFVADPEGNLVELLDRSGSADAVSSA